MNVLSAFDIRTAVLSGVTAVPKTVQSNVVC